MPFDYKKEYKEFYMPKNKPAIAEIPSMNFIAVRGKGDPNKPDGEYKQSIGLLYGIAFTIKMSKLGSHKIDGYFDFVVPPLEGLWQSAENLTPTASVDFNHKENFSWVSLIRLPDFVKKDDFDWAVGEAERKKKTDFSKVEFFTYDEGLCVQCMHIGAYDDEPKTIELMHSFAKDSGYDIDKDGSRSHHEIYLSDPRRVKPERLKTVIRIPIKSR